MDREVAEDREVEAVVVGEVEVELEADETDGVELIGLLRDLELNWYTEIL